MIRCFVSIHINFLCFSSSSKSVPQACDKWDSRHANVRMCTTSPILHARPGGAGQPCMPKVNLHFLFITCHWTKNVIELVHLKKIVLGTFSPVSNCLCLQKCWFIETRVWTGRPTRPMFYEREFYVRNPSIWNQSKHWRTNTNACENGPLAKGKTIKKIGGVEQKHDSWDDTVRKRVRDTLQQPQPDTWFLMTQRRKDGFPLGKSWAAIDATIVSSLTTQAAPQQHRGQYNGTGLRDARRSKRRTCLDFVQPGRCRLVVFGVETGGRLSEETAGFFATSPKPEPAKAPNPCEKKSCAKLSLLPSAPDGPQSWPIPPSAPLRQACYAKTPHPTTTWMASDHHVADSPPTCHVSPPPPAEPKPALKEHGLDLATPPSLRMEADQENDIFVALRMPCKTVLSLPLPGQCPKYSSPRPISCRKKVRGKGGRTCKFYIGTRKKVREKKGYTHTGTHSETTKKMWIGELTKRQMNNMNIISSTIKVAEFIPKMVRAKHVSP